MLRVWERFHRKAKYRASPLIAKGVERGDFYQPLHVQSSSEVDFL